MNLRFINWIWHVRGTLALPQGTGPGTGRGDAIDRLAPLFHAPGTSARRTADALAFTKKDPVAQDKLAVFDSGVLRLESGAGGPVLRYHLVSRALLACFLAPLLFLGFAQLTVAVNALHGPAAAASPAAKADPAPKVLPLNPLDKALGAPEPEPNAKKPEKKPSPTAGYVFAGIFAALYLVGRILEARLARRLFARTLDPFPSSPA